MYVYVCMHACNALKQVCYTCMICMYDMHSMICMLCMYKSKHARMCTYVGMIMHICMYTYESMKYVLKASRIY